MPRRRASRPHARAFASECAAWHVQLLEYFASSKYTILLDWVSIQYLRKLELSLDKKRALQRLKLTSSAGESVPVTFQLSKHETAQGSVWLIDQLLVKTRDPA